MLPGCAGAGYTSSGAWRLSCGLTGEGVGACGGLRRSGGGPLSQAPGETHTNPNTHRDKDLIVTL